MAECIVEIDLGRPGQTGQHDPANGFQQWEPTRARRVEEGGDDWIELPIPFRVDLGEAYDDGTVQHAAAPGKAWAKAAQTSSAWVWKVTTHAGTTPTVRYVAVTSAATDTFGNLVDVDPDTLDPVEPSDPAWKLYVDDADDNLQDQIDNIGDGAVESVAGLTGEIEANALKAALSLPDDTALEVQDLADAVDAEAALARNADNLSSGTIDDARIPSGITRDSELTTGLASKADLVGGVVPTSQIPSIALTSGQVVANRAAMLALSNVQPGDFVAISGTSDKGTYILNDPNPAIFANWIPLSVPTDVVQSVNGQNGVVVLGKTDVGLGSVDNTSDASKPVSTAGQAALDAKAAQAQTTSWIGTQNNTPYTIPTGAKKLLIRAQGAGAGGGSGRRGAAGSVRCGGGSGSGGAYSERLVSVSDLAVATLYIDCDNGGAGGAAVSTNDTDGNPGTAPTRHSLVKTAAATLSQANAVVQAGVPSIGGGGGTNATGTAGSSTSSGRFFSPNGAAASVTGGAGVAGNANVGAGVSGGSGAGLTTGDVTSAGGAGQGSRSGSYVTSPAGGAAGGGVGGAGANAPFGLESGSAGGGGGSGAGAGGAGGSAGYGSGGGGGAASANGNSSGAGGAGGSGFVEITAYF